MNHMMYYNGGYDWYGALFHVLIVALLIALIIRLCSGSRWRRGMWGRWGGPNGVGGSMGFGPEHSSAMMVLKERYAKGEIDKTEFESKKKDLMQ